MKRMFKLRCSGSNDRHTTHDANCGRIFVLTSDVKSFIADNWNGEVEWNGHLPFLADRKKETP